MIRWFWRIYVSCVAVLALAIPAILFGPAIEGRFWPVRINQSIPPQGITRTADRLCWTWISDKVRLDGADNVDVFLDTADADRSYPEVFNRDSGRPWHRNGMLPIGHWALPYCVLMPPHIHPSDPIRLSQIIHYRGFWRLWTVPLSLPDIVDPPGSSVP